jgi:putative ABC transport system ATP-binding protein
MPSPAFTLRRVSQQKEDVRVLDDVTVEIPARRVTAVIGPSGAGKSSLLRLLNRLDDPVAGEIEHGGRPITDIPVRELRGRVGFVFQTPVVFPGSVRDNLAVAAAIAGTADAEEDRIVESLHLAELDGGLVTRDASKLSVGQQQRMNLARALMTKPDVLLMDEPTASLDPETAHKLGQTVAHLSKDRGLTIVAATHRLAEAKVTSDYAIMLDGGKVVEAGPAAELFESTHPRIRAFLRRV